MPILTLIFLECNAGNVTDVEWLQINFGPFKEYLTASDIRYFGLSQVIHGLYATFLMSKIDVH